MLLVWARAFLLVLLLATGSCGAPAEPARGGAPSGAAAESAAGDVPQSLTVAYGFTSAETLPIWIAQETGLYEKYGLRVTAIPVQTGAQAVPAMISGDVQIALLTGLPVVESNFAGADLVIVAGYSNAMRYFLHARPEIQRVEDLRGKRIGITRRGGALIVGLDILLQKHGMVAGTDATIVELGTAATQIDGLAAGVIDAVMVALPTNLIAERAGFPFIEDTKQHNIAVLPSAIVVRRAYLDADPAVVKRYLQAHIEAVELIRRDKELAKRVLGSNTDTDDQELLDRSYEIFVSDLQAVPYPSAEAIQGSIDVVAREQPEVRNTRPADLADDRLVRELDESGFMRR